MYLCDQEKNICIVYVSEQRVPALNDAQICVQKYGRIAPLMGPRSLPTGNGHLQKKKGLCSHRLRLTSNQKLEVEPSFPINLLDI
jgi:hypothetical protein